ncbi:hypothetical protein [Candidatus Poriferisodalis sp.]|uniref:hypothetical protein n=1 Tax=Candidatus Poriferisodalis sp. TaxID=3101277 RepID=UPI003B02AF93
MSWSTGAFAFLHLSPQCTERVQRFLRDECGLPSDKLVDDPHLTVYHARRPLPNLRPCVTESTIRADVLETRFMVMAPGGENPRPELNPSRRSIGLRLTRRNAAIPKIQDLRAEFFKYETPRVLGSRAPSTAWSNAFGARHYQPHITLLRPRPKVPVNLRELGELFRQQVQSLEFDRFEIKLVSRREYESRA